MESIFDCDKCVVRNVGLAVLNPNNRKGTIIVCPHHAENWDIFIYFERDIEKGCPLWSFNGSTMTQEDIDKIMGNYKEDKPCVII